MANHEDDRIVEAAQRAVIEAEARLARAQEVLAEAHRRRDRAQTLNDLAEESNPQRAEQLRRRLRDLKKEK
jgi:hypothetical protein